MIRFVLVLDFGDFFMLSINLYKICIIRLNEYSRGVIMWKEWGQFFFYWRYFGFGIKVIESWVFIFLFIICVIFGELFFLRNGFIIYGMWIIFFIMYGCCK